MGCLYQLTFPNGKSYIGITTESLIKRIGRHINSAKNGADLLLSRAIKKYGKSFEQKILVVANDWSYLCELEKKAIIAYNTFRPNGYNLTKGGEGGYGLIHTEESKKKMSLVQSGKIITNEAKAKMSLAKIGIQLEQYHKDKISKSLKGKKNTLGIKHCDEANKKKSIIFSKLKWFNNGEKSIRAEVQPHGFIAGRLETGRHRYNNGIVGIFAYECPEGFVAGSLKKHS